MFSRPHGNPTDPAPSDPHRQREIIVANKLHTGCDPALAAVPPVSPPLPRILVVDDDHGEAEGLANCFRDLGFATTTCYSGLDGFQKAHDELPDLIVLDMRRPEVDGLDIRQRLSHDPETCRIPVIVLSTMQRPDIIRKSRDTGCEYHVRKPYDANALMVLIETAIKESQRW